MKTETITAIVILILAITLASVTCSQAHETGENLPAARLAELQTARLTQAAKNWPHGNVRHAYVHFNERQVPAVLLYRGARLVGYVAFMPGTAAKPFAILPNELPSLAE